MEHRCPVPLVSDAAADACSADRNHGRRWPAPDGSVRTLIECRLRRSFMVSNQTLAAADRLVL